MFLSKGQVLYRGIIEGILLHSYKVCVYVRTYYVKTIYRYKSTKDNDAKLICFCRLNCS